MMIRRFVFLKRSVFALEPGEQTSLLQAEFDDIRNYTDSTRTTDQQDESQAGPSN